MTSISDVIDLLCEFRIRSYSAGRLPDGEVRTTLYYGRYGSGWTVEYNDPGDSPDVKRHWVEYWLLNHHNGLPVLYTIRHGNRRITATPRVAAREIDRAINDDVEVEIKDLVYGAEMDLIEIVIDD